MPGDLGDVYGIKPVLFRPTAVLGVVLPGTVITGWVVYAGWSLLMR
jgi:phage shock protein PspC (stress-responsive transcriptional regulator)